MSRKYFGRTVRISCLALGLFGVGACGGDPAADVTQEGVVLSIGGVSASSLGSLPVGVTREDIEVGQGAYATCSVCHGTDARGTALGPSLRDSTWIHIDGSADQIIRVIRTGVPTPAEYPVPMPIMGGGDFDSHQLRALAEYVHALSDD